MVSQALGTNLQGKHLAELLATDSCDSEHLQTDAATPKSTVLCPCCGLQARDPPSL
jgi:hypothetical protein